MCVLPHSLQLYDWRSVCAATFTATVRLAQCVCCHIHCNCTIGAVCVMPHSLQLYDWRSVCAATFTATVRLAQCVCCHIHCNCTILFSEDKQKEHHSDFLREIRLNSREVFSVYSARSLSAVAALLTKSGASSDRYKGEMHKKKILRLNREKLNV